MKDIVLIRSKGSGVSAVTYSFVNVTADVNDSRLIYLDTSVFQVLM